MSVLKAAEQLASLLPEHELVKIRPLSDFDYANDQMYNLFGAPDTPLVSLGFNPFGFGILPDETVPEQWNAPGPAQDGFRAFNTSQSVLAQVDPNHPTTPVRTIEGHIRQERIGEDRVRVDIFVDVKNQPLSIYQAGELVPWYGGCGAQGDCTLPSKKPKAIAGEGSDGYLDFKLQMSVEMPEFDPNPTLQDPNWQEGDDPLPCPIPPILTIFFGVPQGVELKQYSFTGHGRATYTDRDPALAGKELCVMLTAGLDHGVLELTDEVNGTQYPWGPHCFFDVETPAP